MRIGIVGSRNFTDMRLMREALADFIYIYQEDIHGVVSGGADGADSMGVEWARKYALMKEEQITEHLPDKQRYGWPLAAFKRNSLIADDADVLFAFFGPGEPPSVNKSGTMDTVRKAIEKRIPIHMYFQEEKLEEV